MLLSSHILAEVEKLCDRVTIIRQGRAVQTGTLDELRYLTRTTVDAVTDRPVSVTDGTSPVSITSPTPWPPRLDVDGPDLGGAVAHLSTFGLRSLVSQPPTLEELFLRHYGDELAAMAVDLHDDGATA